MMDARAIAAMAATSSGFNLSKPLPSTSLKPRHDGSLLWHQSKWSRTPAATIIYPQADADARQAGQAHAQGPFSCSAPFLRLGRGGGPASPCPRSKTASLGTTAKI